MDEFNEEKDIESPNTLNTPIINENFIENHGLTNNKNENIRKNSSFSVSPHQKLAENPKNNTFYTPLNLNPTRNTFFAARPSFLPGMNIKSASYDINAENLSPNKQRYTTFKKKEFWKKSADHKIKQNTTAKSISNVLKKLKGLVTLKLNLAG